MTLRKSPSYVMVSLLTIAAMGLAGCHHDTRAYQPPVAPSYPSPASGAGSRGADTSVGAVRVPEFTPVIPADASLLSSEVGLASWYGPNYNHGRSANGEVYDQDGMTAASRTLPLGAIVRVTNLASGEVAVARITDRGPFIPGRIIDLSLGAAKAAGLYRIGVGKVRVEAFELAGAVVPPAKWCVQIGAFMDPDDALQMKNDLKRRYGAANVISFKGPTGSWVRLTLPVPDKEPSAEVAATVRVPDPGVEAYVTRTN
ncbi:septal ring lytic transglycosylase RlpA family protein [Granulicella sibirica]|uniref:Probable endolytic peptidoglycan transglycosylase RlpA n=1 Tax=Granulicella sibirica TaxID=2479048 RepID=A0A4Q0T559_9BACT|nr:septal ring lytic transglycosylase RlpA family protein [Granulicella sibirica]RXH58875.1 Rare lipoprotein A precursor [Granulicella sibirica]